MDIYVHYYPFEAPDADIRSVLSKFGQIKGLRYKSFPGYSNVKTGSRIVSMVVEREIPSQQSIRGYPCRVWYKGQPIRCNMCRELETKMLLAEAMDTESVASDVDYPDSEVDEVDEAVSDGSNGISDYDISGEDHLLEDVDLSLEKTRSASCSGSCCFAVFCFLLVVPAATAVLVEPLLQLLCLLRPLRLLHLQSSTPQCASGARKENVSDISSVSGSTKPIIIIVFKVILNAMLRIILQVKILIIPV